MNFIYERIGEMLRRLTPFINRSETEISGFEFAPCGYKSGNTPPDGLEWRNWHKDDRFGGVEEFHGWFRGQITLVEVPDGTARYLENYYSDGKNPQYLVYLDGELLQGTDKNHKSVALPPEAGEHEVTMYVYTGYDTDDYKFVPKLVLRDDAAWTLYHDIKTAYDALGVTERDSAAFIRLRDSVNDALNLLDWRQPGSPEFYRSVGAASLYLRRELYGKLPARGDGGRPNIACVGHTHIDTAWLWTFRQTREKVQRSFSTVVRLMERYPEYKFMSSQPQLYQYIKEDEPGLYEQIKRLVSEGRWEPEGAMWVEADCNLTSGESLVRQILYGKEFFRREFGVESHILWLPDVFGYSAAMPQILCKSGVDVFVTSKISWNETNKMPYDMFSWRGIDGSEVFTYFLTPQKMKDEGDGGYTNRPKWYTTYNGDITPSMIGGTWRRMQQKGLTREALNTFGHGDGGGGPTEEMIECGRRLERGLADLPTVSFEFAGDFLDRVRHAAGSTGKLPRWVGELYLEFHRGTYTSNAKNKRNNRKSEYLLLDSEALGTADALLYGGEYPRELLRRGWERVMLCQFHDVLPGSSIKDVYDDTDAIYADVMSHTRDYIGGVREKIAASSAPQAGHALVFNPNGFTASGVVIHDDEAVYVRDVPSLGWASVPYVRGHEGATADIVSRVIENTYIRIEFDEKFEISRIYDKGAEREVLDGTGNSLVAYEDFPRAYDAWEITNYYTEKSYPLDDIVSAETVDIGANVGFCVVRRYMNSTVTQQITVTPYDKKIEFRTEIEWHERHTLLKVHFPIAVNADHATYEIQYGHVTRPTHENTSWDAAQFEVCAHKYADISEHGYGVSLLNDCKYGYACRGTDISLTLLKSATHPNPEADQGHHEFVYALLPHEGDFRDAGVIEEAYLLNRPLRAVKAVGNGGVSVCRDGAFSLASADRANIIVEAVKMAEEDDSVDSVDIVDSADSADSADRVIVRVYDAHGTRSRTKVTFGFDADSVHICDLLEREETSLPLSEDGRSVTVEVGAFEIVTLSVRRKK